MSSYPDRHHPCYFLEDALRLLGSDATVARDERTLGCWGLIVNGKPMVWLIDNRHLHEQEKEDPAAKNLLDAGTLVCHAQKPDMERVGGKWLPLAVTPGYRPSEKPVEKVYDVGMAGYVRDQGRAEGLTHVARHFKLNVGQGLFGDEAIRVYWDSRVALNIPTMFGSPTAYDLNMRFWEALSTNTPLVTNYLPEMTELGITPDVHCKTYRTFDEMVNAIRWLIDHPNEAEAMGAIAANEVALKHTYKDRARQVVEWLGD